MSRRPLHLRTQLSMSMALTAVSALTIFILGMITFYIQLQERWMNSLSEESREVLIGLMENGRVDPDALTTLVSTFSFSWAENYSNYEVTSVIFFVLISVVCSLFIGIIVSRRISRPIESVTEAVLRVAEGDFNPRIPNEPHASIEARNLRHSFNQMVRSLQLAERETNASAAAIAHELRTPLTILRGRLQGLNEGAFDPSPAMFDALLGQVETLSRIVDDLSTLTKMNAELYSPNVVRMNLAVEAQTVLTSLAPGCKEEGITLEQVLEPAWTHAEPARIRQALNALLENASRYAGIGKYIRVETGKDGDNVYVRVIDHGPGIEEAHLDCVFDRWWRADASRARAEGGSGLGLAIVRAIARAHGGDATVSANQSASGVTFSIRLAASTIDGCNNR